MSSITFLRKARARFTVPSVFVLVGVLCFRIFKAVETAVEVYKNRSYRIPTKAFNNVMLPIIEKTPPPAYKRKYV